MCTDPTVEFESGCPAPGVRAIIIVPLYIWVIRIGCAVLLPHPDLVVGLRNLLWHLRRTRRRHGARLRRGTFVITPAPAPPISCL